MGSGCSWVVNELGKRKKRPEDNRTLLPWKQRKGKVSTEGTTLPGH